MAFNLFEKILWTKEDPTQGLMYKTLNRFEPQANMATEALKDTTKMYEQKAQNISQWAQNTANKPWYVKLWQMVKSKHPEYSDMSDEELGQKMLAKYPEYKDIVSGQTTAIGQWAKILWGIGSMAVSAPWMVTGGAEQLGTGMGKVASARSKQDVIEWYLQQAKWATTAGFWVATGAMPVASTAFWGATGFEPVQQGLGYVAGKAGDISAGTAWFLGGNQQVQEQARWLGEIALPVVALKWVSVGGKYAKPVTQAAGKAIVRWVEAVPKKIKAIPTAIKKAPWLVDDMIESWVEKLATKALGSSDGTAELFKATSPSYNVLAKSKDIGKIKQKASVADNAVVEAWFVPKTTTERVDAYKATMKKVWDDVEKARWAVAEKYKSDSIADTIVSEIEKMKVNWKIPPSLESDVSALLKEADFYRSVGDVSLPDLWVIRSNINARLTFGDKTQFSDAYNAVMKKVITAIKDGEDAVLTRNAWKTTSDLLSKYGALRSMLDDVIKQDIKASRAKWLPIEESFGRISGLAEMAWWVWQLVMNPKQAIPSIVSGGSKVLLGKVAGKLKDTDYLIKTGYEKLLKSKKPKNGNNTWNTTVVRPNSTSPKAKQVVKPKK